MNEKSLVAKIKELETKVNSNPDVAVLIDSDVSKLFDEINKSDEISDEKKKEFSNKLKEIHAKANRNF